ncbi:WD repeat-containing protein 61 [Actinomortierella wolfii]|nr:WD repeat-containing protein 61 [Actinomortierella wolfii]
MPTQFLTSLVKENAHDDEIWCVAWSAKNEVITGSADSTLKVWDGETGDLKGTLSGHHLAVNSVDVNEDGTLAVSTSLDSQVRIWDLATLQQKKVLEIEPMQAWGAKFSPDATQILTGSSSGNLHLYNVETGAKEKTFEGRGHFAMCVAWSPNGAYVACGTEAASDSATVLLFEASTGKLLHSYKGHAMTVRSIAFSPDSTKLVSGSDDGRIMIYDTVHGDTIRALSGHSSWVISVALSNDGVHLASGSSDHKVKLWDLVADQCIDTLDGHSGQVWGLAWNKQGNKAVSVAEDRSIRNELGALISAKSIAWWTFILQLGMLRRDPTRIELRNEDLAEFEKLREEYLEKQEANKSKSKDALLIGKHAPAPPPPTPASAGSGKHTRGGNTTTRETGVDAIERAGRERKAKTARERIGAN